MEQNTSNRDAWGSKLGLVLALAGNAIGLGNFLRFPVQAAENGGGAFMLPYFISLILLGIPLMWVELTMGRFGGNRGHGSMPGMFYSMWNNRWSKYIGILGILPPYHCHILYLCRIMDSRIQFLLNYRQIFRCGEQGDDGCFFKGFSGCSVK